MNAGYFQQVRARRARGGFSLTEVLVIMGIIVILVSMLLPLIGRGVERGRSASCIANLKQVAGSMNLYTADHDGRYPVLPNGSAWDEDDPASLRRYGWYWGRTIREYIPTREVVRWPQSFEDFDDWYYESGRRHLEEARQTTYGVNAMGLNTWTGSAWRSRARSSVLRPAETILCQDAFEQRLDGGAEDTLSSFGGGRNLLQWRRLKYLYPNAFEGWWRHNGYSKCNTVYQDGHAGQMGRTDGTDVDERIYSGEWNTRP